MAQPYEYVPPVAGRDTLLVTFALALITAGFITLPTGRIATILGGIILLAFGLSWLARVIIAGETEALGWVMLAVVGAMALPLESVRRRVVGALMALTGLAWIVHRVLRHEARQTQK